MSVFEDTEEKRKLIIKNLAACFGRIINVSSLLRGGPFCIGKFLRTHGKNGECVID